MDALLMGNSMHQALHQAMYILVTLLDGEFALQQIRYYLIRPPSMAGVNIPAEE